MAGLKGLKKTPIATLEHAQSKAAEAFIGGAKVKSNVDEPSESQASFKRTNFSLSDHVSEEIDRLSFLPRDFRASRSDVVRAAVSLLAELTPDEVIDRLRAAQVRGRK